MDYLTKKLPTYFLIGLFSLFFNLESSAQKKNSFFVKTNLTNIVFKSPTIALEQKINQHAFELSYGTGHTKQFLHYSDYAFKSILMRYKNNMTLKNEQFELYMGGYFGYLNRSYNVDFTRYYNNGYSGGTLRGGLSSGAVAYLFNKKNNV